MHPPMCQTLVQDERQMLLRRLDVLHALGPSYQKTSIRLSDYGQSADFRMISGRPQPLVNSGEWNQTPLQGSYLYQHWKSFVLYDY